MLLWFILITSYVIVQNFGYAALQVWLLRRRQPWPKALGIAVIAWAFLMNGLLLLEILEPHSWKAFLRDWFYLPMAVEMVWNVLLLQVLFPAMILVVLVVRWRARHKKTLPLAQPGISRRRFLYLVSYGAAPATALAMGVHGEATRTDLQVRQFDVPMANLPPELDGLTIAHISDLHSGIFVGPERLKIISDAANDLKADLVVVTGDIINREMGEFPDALAAIKRIESPFGTFLCEGNHDYAPGPGIFVAACMREGLRMMFNNSVLIPVRGRNLHLAGISWKRTLETDTRPNVVSDLFRPHPSDAPRILLAHHPDIFDVSQEADLVLSGHTHGGQIMFGDIGLGRLRFKYWSGLYQRGKTSMIVSNGCGDWFPCRIGAPAEVGLIRLKRANPA